ncbi:MAG: hypothetical protein IPO92_20235 [Saprospiraceae bacterium]|nr:hypothetical protein [Saprospiraceae bacterium]
MRNQNYIISIFFIISFSFLNAQEKVIKADFLNPSANIFMERVSPEIKKISSSINSDGTIEIKRDIKISKETIIKILGFNSNYKFI